MIQFLVFLSLLIAQSIPFPGPGGVSGHNGYFARPITIDHTQVGTADSSNFPLVVVGTYSYLATVANGGNVASSSGFDIVYTSDSACLTTLNFERVSWSASTGAVEFWIQVPTVSHTSDTVIYECYGNAATITDQQNVTATWDTNTKARYHLEANGTDSTGNNNGTLVTVNSQPNFTAAQIGKGAHHSDTNNSAYIDLGTMGNLYNGSNTVETVSFWIHPEVTLVAANTVGYGQVTPTTQPTYYSYVGETSTTAESTYCVTSTCASFAQIKFTSGFTFSLNTWYRIMAVLDLTTNANSKFYVNGTDISATFGSAGTTPTIFNTTTAHMALFRKGTDRLLGTEDEVGFDNTGRSSSWALLDYNNQKTSSTLLTIGSPL